MNFIFLLKVAHSQDKASLVHKVVVSLAKLFLKVVDSQVNLVHKAVASQVLLAVQVLPVVHSLLVDQVHHQVLDSLQLKALVNDQVSLEATLRENTCHHDRRHIVQTENVKYKTTKPLVLTLFIYFAFIIVVNSFLYRFYHCHLFTKIISILLLILFNAMDVKKRIRFLLKVIVELDPIGSSFKVNCKRKIIISFIFI